MVKLVDEEGRFIPSSIVQDKNIRLLTPLRIGILKTLFSSSKYPAEIARELGMPLQLAYYHMRILEKAGFLEFVDYEERNGGVAKRYKVKSDSFSVLLNDNWKSLSTANAIPPEMLGPFVRNGLFDGKIIIGSPDPHGKYRARASETGVLELAMFIGHYAVFDFPVYLLDTQITSRYKQGNLVLSGGPKVNMLVDEINPRLPIRFLPSNSELYSSVSKKTYTGNIGTIQLIKSPFSKAASILFVGGINHFGTRAAVLAFVKHCRDFHAGKHSNSGVGRVVEGFDEDGDGIIDAVEILE